MKSLNESRTAQRHLTNKRGTGLPISRTASAANQKVTISNTALQKPEVWRQQAVKVQHQSGKDLWIPNKSFKLAYGARS